MMSQKSNILLASVQQLQRIREYELDKVLSALPKGSSILEIGAGAGWQAKVLATHGFVVKAIDVKESGYGEHQVWPVLHYDGVHIPFPDNHFDVVFSSNVLEHIAYVEQFQFEIKRIVKPEGLAIHILPTSSWRFWSNISHYLNLGKIFLSKSLWNSLQKDYLNKKVFREPSKHNIKELLRKLLKNAFPSLHGEIGNFFSEIYLFSRFRWTALFRRTDWQVQSYYPNRLFYTGYSIFDSILSIQVRHIMSYILGSSCLIYVLKNKSTVDAVQGNQNLRQPKKLLKSIR